MILFPSMVTRHSKYLEICFLYHLSFLLSCNVDGTRKGIKNIITEVSKFMWNTPFHIFIVNSYPGQSCRTSTVFYYDQDAFSDEFRSVHMKNPWEKLTQSQFILKAFSFVWKFDHLTAFIQLIEIDFKLRLEWRSHSIVLKAKVSYLARLKHCFPIFIILLNYHYCA